MRTRTHTCTHTLTHAHTRAHTPAVSPRPSSALSLAVKDNPTNQKLCIDGKLCSSIIIMGIKAVPPRDTFQVKTARVSQMAKKCD